MILFYMKSPSDPCKIDWITKEIEVDTSSAVETKIFHLHVNLHAISRFRLRNIISAYYGLREWDNDQKNPHFMGNKNIYRIL